MSFIKGYNGVKNGLGITLILMPHVVVIIIILKWQTVTNMKE